jgi:hypothetical protein
MSSSERHFWEKMTFRQVAILIIRIQAVDLFIRAIEYSTVLPSYFRRFNDTFLGAEGHAAARESLAYLLLKMALFAAAGLACLQFSEAILRWFVKDLIPNRTSESSIDPAERLP